MWSVLKKLNKRLDRFSVIFTITVWILVDVIFNVSSCAIKEAKAEELFISADSECRIKQIGEKSLGFEYCKANENLVFVKVVNLLENGTVVETYGEGETYFKAVNDKNGPHIEIHLSASFLKNSCDLQADIMTGLLTLSITSLGFPEVAIVVGSVYHKLFESTCNVYSNGMWINIYPNPIRIESGNL